MKTKHYILVALWVMLCVAFARAVPCEKEINKATELHWQYVNGKIPYKVVANQDKKVKKCEKQYLTLK